jgi:hypothetical protein
LVGGFAVLALVIATVFLALTVRAARLAAIIDEQIVEVRRIFSSTTFDLSDVRRFEGRPEHFAQHMVGCCHHGHGQEGKAALLVPDLETG